MIEKNSAHYRGVARDNLKDNWGTAILICLIVFGISSFGTMLSVWGSILTIVITGPLTVVEIRYFRALHNKQKPTVGTGFTDFGKDFAGNVGAYTLETVYTFLWSLLFVIPGIIKSYAYSMTMFLKSKNPELEAGKAIELSQKIMQGRKWKLFCLDISFAGWLILSIFTLGIGLLFLLPYMNASHIAFYENACIEYQEQIGNIVDVDNTINNDDKIEEE